jgi:hypothetical protein
MSVIRKSPAVLCTKAVWIFKSVNDYRGEIKWINNNEYVFNEHLLL